MAHYPEKAYRPADIAQAEMFEENPFLEGFRIATRWKREGVEGDPRAVVNLTTGTMETTAEIVRHVEVDREAFVKVFSAHLRVFFDLSQKGIRLLEVVMAEMAAEKNSDLIYLSASSALDYHRRGGKPFSQATFYRAKDELMEKGFIAPAKHKHQFWLNPALFWNGDRIQFITEIRRAPEIISPRQ